MEIPYFRNILKKLKKYKKNKTNNNYTYLKTVEEVQQYVGKIIVCYYYEDYHKELNDKNLFDPDNENRQISYMWMCKLTRVVGHNKSSVSNASLYGINTIRLYGDSLTNKPKKIASHFNIEEISTAQTYVRLATPQEIKIYLQLNRNFRIYKHD